MADIKFSSEAHNDLMDIKSYITEELRSEASAVKTIDQMMKRNTE